MRGRTAHASGHVWAAGCTGRVASSHGTGASDVYFVSDALATVYHVDGVKISALTTAGSTSPKLGVYATPTRVFLTTSDGEVLTGLGGSFASAVQTRGKLSAILGWSADRAWVGGLYGYVLSYKP